MPLDDRPDFVFGKAAKCMVLRHIPQPSAADSVVLELVVSGACLLVGVV